MSARYDESARSASHGPLPALCCDPEKGGSRFCEPTLNISWRSKQLRRLKMLQNENIASIRAPRLIPVWHDEHPRRAGPVDDDSQSDTPRHPQPKTGAVGRGADRSRAAAADIPLFFWDGVHPSSGLARDRRGLHSDPKDDAVAVGGSGSGVMAIIVARKEDGLRGRTP
nr:Conserved hypothetical protein [Methylocystis sp. SC2]